MDDIEAPIEVTPENVESNLPLALSLVNSTGPFKFNTKLPPTIQRLMDWKLRVLRKCLEDMPEHYVRWNELIDKLHEDNPDEIWNMKQYKFEVM